MSSQQTALRSYVYGSWFEPRDAGAPLFDAVTGDQVATITSDGIDMQAVLTHGREVGGPASRAGVPTVVKPASATAYLTARLIELIVESGLLPEGSVQLICGSVGDLFDHFTDQDLLSFTGSATTAQKLRTDPTVAAKSVRFSAEADSLNRSILGPDAAPGTPEFDLYVKQLVSEMTVKAGQKCTAIRRALVPAEHVDVGSIVTGDAGFATWSWRWRPACSSARSSARCWPITASTICVSSRR